MAGAERRFLIALARAFGGALVFALPLFMTMGMWQLGSTMRPLRLALFLFAMFPVLGGLAYYAGLSGGSAGAMLCYATSGDVDGANGDGMA